MDKSRVRRVQALLCTGPVHELQASRNQRGGVWSEIDCYDLVLEAIDTVVDRMGFDVGCDQADLEAHLSGYVSGVLPEAAEQAEDIAHTVVEVLIRPRRGVYTDDRRRPFDFALLREHPGIDGPFLVATREAINVLIGALDTDVASAQAASEAQLNNLLRRNKLSDAARVAKDARVRSIQYGQEVRRIITDTRRDVRRAGWSGDVPRRMREIIDHLNERLDLEQRMLGALREHRDAAGREDLAKQASELIATVSDCMTRHRELHNLVLEADASFYTEQHRQAFVPGIHLQSVDLIDELLGPILAATIGASGDVVTAFASATWGPQIPRLVRLDSFLAMLLADTRDIDRDGVELPDNDLDDDAADARRFSDEAQRSADELFAKCREAPMRLAELVREARVTQIDGLVDLVVLRSLAAFDPELGRPKANDAVLASVDDGRSFSDDDWQGSDLLVGFLTVDGERLIANPPQPGAKEAT
jgi:hypothetical protein